MRLHIVVVVATVLVAACQRHPAPRPDLAPSIGETERLFHNAGVRDGVVAGDAIGFEEIYSLFLRDHLRLGPKAALWSARYHRRWIRWIGRIRSFSDNGITLRQLPLTSTFDVSLWLNRAAQAQARAHYRVGDIVEYSGRLESFDDIWRTLYLVNGSIIGLREVPAAEF
jgi:hypothetical protein